MHVTSQVARWVIRFALTDLALPFSACGLGSPYKSLPTLPAVIFNDRYEIKAVCPCGHERELRGEDSNIQASTLAQRAFAVCAK